MRQTDGKSALVIAAAAVPALLLFACAANPTTGMPCADDSECADSEVCGADGRCRTTDAGGTDAGDTDAGDNDAGLPGDDAGTDAGSQIDAGPPDSGPTDGGSPDAGFDAGPPDAGFDAGFDAGPPDAGFDAGPADAGLDAGGGCVWMDVPCATGAPIRDFCPPGRTVSRLRRCDSSLFTPTPSYLDFELCNCGCVMGTCVSWSQVECCP